MFGFFINNAVTLASIALMLGLFGGGYVLQKTLPPGSSAPAHAPSTQSSTTTLGTPVAHLSPAGTSEAAPEPNSAASVSPASTEAPHHPIIRLREEERGDD